MEWKKKNGKTQGKCAKREKSELKEKNGRTQGKCTKTEKSGNN